MNDQERGKLVRSVSFFICMSLSALIGFALDVSRTEQVGIVIGLTVTSFLIVNRFFLKSKHSLPLT